VRLVAVVHLIGDLHSVLVADEHPVRERVRSYADDPVPFDCSSIGEELPNIDHDGAVFDALLRACEITTTASATTSAHLS